jgi:hypothetical protein
VITRKEIARIAKLTFYGMAGEWAAANSADHGGNRTATHTTDVSPRPAVSPMGQRCLSFGAASSRRGINPRQSPPRGFLRGGGVAGRGRVRFSEKPFGSALREMQLLHLTVFKINCNGMGNETR